MSPTKKTYVLDANAILDYVQDGVGAGTVERLLREALRDHSLLLISTVNLGEVFYWLWMSQGEQKARRILDDITMLPLRVLPVDLSQALKAGEMKARHKIPYVDSIAAALTDIQQATLVTSDRDFEKLGRKIPILWVPRA